MQPFKKYSRLKLANLRQSRGCTKIGLKSVIMHRFRKFFHWCLPDICANYFVPGSFRSEKLHSRVLSFESGKTHFSRFFHVFDPPNGGKGSSWGADFSVVGKPIPTFLIAVHWSHFDISVRFLTNRLNIAKKTRFSSGGSLRRSINRLRSRDTAKLLISAQTRGIDFSNVPERKLCDQGFGHSVSGSLRDTHTHPYITMALPRSPLYGERVKTLAENILVFNQSNA